MILGLAFASRLTVVILGDFIYHADVTSQYLEPAWRLVSGQGTIFWEQYYGARSQLVPSLLAVVMAALLSMGVDHPTTLRAAVEVVLCGVSLLVPWGMYAFARTAFDERVGRVALVLGAVWYELVALAGQPLSELIAMGPLLWTFALAADARVPRRAAALGVLLIVTCALRYQYAPVALAACVLAWPGLGGSGRARLLAAVAVSLALLAVFDMATVGGPLFRSYAANLAFNLAFAGEVVALGADTPWTAYPLALILASGGLVAVGVVGIFAPPATAVRVAHAKWLLLPMALLLGAHSASPWKEYRFILAAVPFWLVGLAVTLVFVGARPGRERALVAGLLALWVACASVLGLLFQLPGQVSVHASHHRWSLAFVGPPDPRLEFAGQMLEDTNFTALAEVGIDPGLGLGQVHLGRKGGNVPIYDGHAVAALRACGLEPSAYASHAMLPPGIGVPGGFPVQLADARGWRLVATGHPVRPPSWLSLSPVSSSGFFPSVARRVFEPQSGNAADPTAAVRWWSVWRGDGPVRSARAPMAVGGQGLPPRTAPPSDCAGTARLDRGAAENP